MSDNVDAGYPGLSARGYHQGSEHPHCGRFAGPIWSEQPKNLASVHLQIQSIYGEKATRITLRQIFAADSGFSSR